MPSQRSEVERLLEKYESDIASLEEQEKDIQRRIQIMENLIPTVLIWYMWKVSQAEKPVPLSTQTEEDAQRKLLHLETILAELQEADQALKEEENVMRKRIEELEESLKDTKSIDFMLSEPSTSRLKAEREKVMGEVVGEDKEVMPEKRKQVIFKDLLKDEATDWKQTCEDLYTEMSGLRENLQETTEKLKESENYIKKLEDDNKLKDGVIQQKIHDLETETKAIIAEVIEKEEERVLEEEREDVKVLLAVTEAMEDVKAMKKSLQIKAEIEEEEEEEYVEETKPIQLGLPPPHKIGQIEEMGLKKEESPKLLQESIDEKIIPLVLTPEEVIMPGSAEILPKPPIHPPQIFEELEVEAAAISTELPPEQPQEAELKPDAEIQPVEVILQTKVEDAYIEHEVSVSEILPSEPLLDLSASQPEEVQPVIETLPIEPAIQIEVEPIQTEIEAPVAKPEELPEVSAIQMEAEPPTDEMRDYETNIQTAPEQAVAEPEVIPELVIVATDPESMPEAKVKSSEVEDSVTKTETLPDEPTLKSEIITAEIVDVTEPEFSAAELELVSEVLPPTGTEVHATVSEAPHAEILESEISQSTVEPVKVSHEYERSTAEPVKGSTSSPAREAGETVEALAITSEPFDVQTTAEPMPSTSTSPAMQQGQSAMRGQPGADHLATQALQGKCRVKDHLIKSMADELRDLAKSNVWAGSEMLASTSKDPVKTYDFDRTTLLQYLKGKEPKDMGSSLKSNESYSTTNPLNVKVIRKLDKNSLMIEWGPPPSNETIGYQIFIDEEFKYWVHSAKRNIALLHPLDLRNEIEITVCPVGDNGKILHRSSIKYTP
uniref:Uncharacterized protein n=1 Tax=Cuerna arida TaxID=1464854 RepID=A0A1B6G0U8_9HEMI